MGPKAATYDDKLIFILQCLHSIKDSSGNPVKPDFKALEPLLNLKHNSLYVRYRGIVNKEVEKGAPGIFPIGSKANAEAAAASSTTVAPGDGTVKAPASSSLVKNKLGRKRKAETKATEEEEYAVGAKRKKMDSAMEAPSLPSLKDEGLPETDSDADAEGEPDDEY